MFVCRRRAPWAPSAVAPDVPQEPAGLGYSMGEWKRKWKLLFRVLAWSLGFRLGTSI